MLDQNPADDGQVIHRELIAEVEPSGDGRTLDLRIVPYNTVARVSDGGPTYDEEWLPGCFDKQLNAPNRVLVNFEHQPGLRDVVGRGTELRETATALEGTFRMLVHPDADKALELINEKVLTGISLEAVPLKSVNTDGVVQRVKARLVNIALCRMPAFADSQVLAVREQPDEPAPDPPAPEPEPTEPSPAAAMLQRVGFEPIVSRVIAKKAWDGSAARFSDEEWQRSCILDRGEQFDTAKTRYAVPVLEPSGDLNVNAMHAAASVLAGGRGGVSAPPAAKAAAARKLRRYYGMAGEQLAPAMMAMAGR